MCVQRLGLSDTSALGFPLPLQIASPSSPLQGPFSLLDESPPLGPLPSLSCPFSLPFVLASSPSPADLAQSSVLRAQQHPSSALLLEAVVHAHCIASTAGQSPVLNPELHLSLTQTFPHRDTRRRCCCLNGMWGVCAMLMEGRALRVREVLLASSL